MATTTQEQIVRESPEIEAYRLGLLDLAKQRGEIPVNIPQQQIAGMTGNQLNAISMAQNGIGAYQPYLNNAQSYMGQAGGMFGAAPGSAQGYAQNAIGTGQQYINSGLQQGQGQGQQALNTAGGLASLAQGFAGQGQQQIVNPAVQAGQQAVGYGLQGAQAYDPNSAAAYMNPYTQDVINQSMAEIDRQASGARQATASNAVSKGAFGGSRDAVMRAELERGIMNTKAGTIANLNNANFAQAQNAAINNFQNQQGRIQNVGNMALQGGQLASNAGIASLGLGANTALQSGQMLGGMGLNYANMLQSGGLQAGQTMGGLNLTGGQLATGAQLDAARGIASLGQNSATMGGLAQAYGQADSSFLYNMGANQQKQDQAVLDSNYQHQLATQYEPFQRISWINDIYSKAPSSQQSLTSNTTPDPSALSQIVGAGIAGYGALNAFNKATSTFGS